MDTATMQPMSDTETCEIARCCLATWLREFPEAYYQLFGEGMLPRAALPGNLTALERLGIVSVSEGMISAARCVYPLDGMFILCDRPTEERLDRVFPIFSDESILLAHWLAVRPGDVVLDLGTGSGVVALAAVKQNAGKVFASDVNDHVRECLDLSLRLNGMADRVEYVESDVFEQFDGQRFDIIACNPPFVPVPRALDYYVHSDGGPLGTAIIARILRGAEDHLSRSGRLYMLALSLGGPNGWRIDSLLSKPARDPGSSCAYWTDAVYCDPLLNLAPFTDRFKVAPDHQEWIGELNERNYDRLQYFAVYRGPLDDLVKTRLTRVRSKLADCSSRFWPSYVGSMSNRLGRYALSS